MLLLLDSSLCGCWIQACGVATERRCNSDFDDLQVGIAKVGVLPCLPNCAVLLCTCELLCCMLGCLCFPPATDGHGGQPGVCVEARMPALCPGAAVCAAAWSHLGG